ncbi:MAG: hypothetical protein H6Q89_4681, partial [Myxococcaceae bacterium]|nr:hypothetical protein [Myxococcaceae bacterium]
MTTHPLWIAAVALLAAGCFGSNPYSEYRNMNSGEQGNLTLYGQTAAIGEATRVYVSRSEEGNYDCATYPTPFSYGGSSSSVHCHFAGVLSPVEALLEAQCDQGGCTAAIANGAELSVTGQSKGTFTLTVKARLADGTVLVDSTRMSFVAVDGIAVDCVRDYACPGPNAILPGAKFSWSAQPMSEGALISGAVRVSVDQPGIVELTGTGEEYAVRALKPGVATLRLRSGKAERVQTIRVAAIEDVVGGSVRFRRDVSCLPVICVDGDVDLLGDAAPARITRLAPTFVLAWALRDGTFAVGGAGRITSPTPGVEVLVAGRYEPAPTDLELMNFTVGGSGGALCHA